MSASKSPLYFNVKLATSTGIYVDWYSFSSVEELTKEINGLIEMNEIDFIIKTSLEPFKQPVHIPYFGLED